MCTIKRKKFNVSILGETQVGKTNMVCVLKGQGFQPQILSTIGIDNFVDKAVFDNTEYTFKIFDTAGQERYQKVVADSTIKIADGFLMVFSVDKAETLQKINYWLNFIDQHTNLKEKVLLLVGNKIDLQNREVSNEEGFNFAKERKMKYFETSAKTGFGIKEAFQQLYKDIYDLHLSLDNKNEGNNKKQTENIVIKKEDVKVDKKKKKKC